MKNFKPKEVTTNGAEGGARLREQSRRRPRATDMDVGSDFDRVSVMGLHDEELLDRVLVETVPQAERSVAIDELEARLGWEEAARRLSATGAGGQALARAHWGPWMDTLPMGAMPAGMSPEGGAAPMSSGEAPAQAQGGQEGVATSKTPGPVGPVPA